MLTHTLGFPRIGRNRELKKAVEGYWKGNLDGAALEAECRRLRLERWRIQREAGVDIVPVGDFPLYDHMLDAAAMLGCIPARYGRIGGEPDADTRFRMARGDARPGFEVTAMEMTKWFDTNYHYIVPEFEPGQSFRVACAGLEREIAEAKAEGFQTKAVIPGPFTFLALGKGADGLNPWDLLDDLAGAYGEILERIGAVSEWIQLDEPVLATDLPGIAVSRFPEIYAWLLRAAGPARVMLATYFGGITDNLGLLRELPLAGLHLDLVRAPEQLDSALDAFPEGCALSMGVVDGRNIWRTDLDAAANTVRSALDRLGPDRVLLAPSCSLLHAPVDLAGEAGIVREIKSWWPLACRSARNCGSWPTTSPEWAGTRPWPKAGPRSSPGKKAPRSTTRRCARAWPKSRRTWPRGPRPMRSARPRRASASDCPSCPPPPSAPFPRPWRCGGTAVCSGPGRWTGRPMKQRWRPTSRTASGGRRRPGWTCWSMASRNATTWWNTSANSLRVSSSPATAGSRATAPGASSRRSSTATCPVPSP